MKDLLYNKFHGQFGEDKILSNFFNNTYIGTCVEVGADNGISGSNTYHFEKNGWKCLCIEPIPESFKDCNFNRQHSLNLCAADIDIDNIEFSVITILGNTSAISSLKIDERLIENYKNLITDTNKIYVNVRTLNTIFKETNFPTCIDFISIDTENTELNVLKGLDLEKYDVKFFLIENNFNESIIEEYLITKNFKKIYRNFVNDFYVNNNYLNKKIFDRYELEYANYFIFESTKNVVVIDLVKIYIQRYELSKINDLIIQNDIFFGNTNTENNKNNLYITFRETKTGKQFKFIFHENELLDFEKIYQKLKNN
jgi:FkbM family methyltransferase